MPKAISRNKRPIKGTGNQFCAVRLDQVQPSRDDIKNTGGSWFNVAHNTTSGKGQNPDGRMRNDPRDDPAIISEGRKGYASGAGNLGKSVVSRTTSSRSPARKAASAMIAKIPVVLARHIARSWYPDAPTS